MKRDLLLLAACSLVFAFFGIGAAYRSDEVWSLNTISQQPSQIVDTLKQDTHPPLYFLALAGWCRIFGTSEAGLRSFSSVLYLAGIGVVYFAGRSLYDGIVALWAAVLFAISPLTILAAQFGRMYAMLALLSAVSAWAFLELNRAKWKPGGWLLLWIAATGLGTFTHVWFFFLIAAQGVCGLVLLLKRSDFPRLALFSASLGVALAPYALLWLPTLLYRQIPISGNIMSWVPRPGLEAIAATALMLAGAFLFLLPVLFVRGKRPDPLPGVLLLVALAIPFLLSYAKPVYYTRYTIIGVPLFSLFAAQWTASRLPRSATSFVLLLTAAVFIFTASRSNACDSRHGAEFLVRNAKSGDLAVFSSLSRLPLDYYLKKRPDAPALQEISFPVEIDSHTGYEGRLDGSDRIRVLNEQAEQLVDRARRHPGRRVFYFYGFHLPTDNILKTRMDAKLRLISDRCLECGDPNISYFNHILAYEAPLF